MRADDFLFSQGFGTRRVCAGLIQQGFFEVFDSNVGIHVEFDATNIEATDGLSYRVQGKTYEYHERAYLMLHKPTGHECSQKPGAWPSIYSLLPAPLRQRPASNKTLGVQAIGRLDQDTTGLLLLSDDGAFIHRMASPKHHVPKVYQVTCAEAPTDKQIARLLEGVVLNDDPKPVKGEAVERTGENSIALTLTQGKYHQVKRMLAAVGNEVVGLHRSQIGDVHLPADLPAGQWRWLSSAERAALGVR
jgi:16S rRNA pseudouridine516 synthase